MKSHYKRVFRSMTVKRYMFSIIDNFMESVTDAYYILKEETRRDVLQRYNCFSLFLMLELFYV